MTQSEQRIGNIDTAKGILIILVVIGHVLNLTRLQRQLLKHGFVAFIYQRFLLYQGY